MQRRRTGRRARGGRRFCGSSLLNYWRRLSAGLITFVCDPLGRSIVGLVFEDEFRIPTGCSVIFPYAAHAGGSASLCCRAKPVLTHYAQTRAASDGIRAGGSDPFAGASTGLDPAASCEGLPCRR